METLESLERLKSCGLFITFLWFGFLCAAKDQKAPLFLDQILLQVSAKKPNIDIFDIHAPLVDCLAVA